MCTWLSFTLDASGQAAFSSLLLVWMFFDRQQPLDDFFNCVPLDVIGEQKGSVHYSIQRLPQQEAGVMRWFQVQQALKDGQQLDRDWRAAHFIEER